MFSNKEKITSHKYDKNQWHWRSNCQTLRILFTSYYVVYVNLNTYFQSTLNSCQWPGTLLNHWQKMFIIQLSRNLSQSTAQSKKFWDIQKKLPRRLDNCCHYVWFRSLDEGLSTRMEQPRKIKEPHYYDRSLPSHYGLFQDDWEKNVWIWF